MKIVPPAPYHTRAYFGGVHPLHPPVNLYLTENSFYSRTSPPSPCDKTARTDRVFTNSSVLTLVYFELSFYEHFFVYF